MKIGVVMIVVSLALLPAAAQAQTYAGSDEGEFKADPRFDIVDINGAPAVPGDTIRLDPVASILQTTVFYVDAAFYADSVLLGRVTQTNHNITISSGLISGNVNNLNFGTYYYADAVNIVVGTRSGGGPVFEWNAYSALPADYNLPVSPAANWLGFALMLAVISWVLIRRRA